MSDEMPFIRAMAKTLCDKGVNPLFADDVRIATTLITAGWSAAMIDRNFDAVRLMSTIWFVNEGRKGHRHATRSTLAN